MKNIIGFIINRIIVKEIIHMLQLIQYSIFNQEQKDSVKKRRGLTA